MNREEWLTKQAGEIAPLLDAAGKPLPKCRITCGFALGRKDRAYQVWPASASGDGTVEVLISPTLSDAASVFVALAAALAAAAAAPLETVGLDQTGAMVDGRWMEVIEAAGDYPHAAITIGERPTQTTRMLKACCPGCGYTIRLTAKWAKAGLPACPVGGETLALAGGAA